MVNRRPFGLSSLATGVFAGAAHAGASHPSQTQADLLQRFLHDRVAPGGFVAVTSGHAMTSVQTWGHASKPFAQPVTDRTLFHLGSCGKQVTALAILKLQKDGRVDPSRPVGDYIAGLPDTWAAVPVSRLLDHTSGLPEYLAVLTEWDRPQTRETVLNAMRDRPLDFTPGEAWSYSNTGYLLLGWLISDVTGGSYAEYLREALFEPAGLPTARADAAEELIDQRAEPYTWRDDQVVHAARMESSVSAAGDGGVLMSASDAAPWRAALEHGRLVDAGALRQALVAAPLATGRAAPYNYGFFLDQTGGRQVHAHSGETPGFVAYWLALPEAGLSALVAANYDGPRGVSLSELAAAALEANTPGSTWLSLAGEQVDGRARALKSILTRGEATPDAAVLAPETLVLLRMNRLRRMTVDDIRPLESWSVGRTEHVRYRIRSGSETRHLVAGWTEDDKLYWLY